MLSPGSSPNDYDAQRRADGGALLQVLDIVLGFFVWAGHFLSVYVATAVACTLGLGGAGSQPRTVFLAALSLLTIISAALVAWHAFSRYRRGREVEQRTRMAVTVGCDALAMVAILWQFFPILLVPPCA